MGGTRARQNAMRSLVVVLGAAAFSYLSFQVGFKPYLERAARESMDRSVPTADEPLAGDGGEGERYQDSITVSHD